MLRQVKDILFLKLGADDGDVGRARDIYFDDQTWTARYLVADTGTWLPGRLVLISPASVGPVDETNKVLKVNLLKRQIEAAPSIDLDKPVSRQHEVEYAEHYGWPMYWDGPALWGATPLPVYERSPTASRPEGVIQADTGDPHLRSAGEVNGYHIQAQDDEIGHVEDLIVDDTDWAIRYLVVDTGNWLSGKKVLLAPQWIREVSWDNSRVVVALASDGIRNAPEYDAGQPITRAYEEALFRHYRREGYWARHREREAVA